MHKASCINKVHISRNRIRTNLKMYFIMTLQKLQMYMIKSSHYEPRTGNRDSCPWVKWSKHEAHPSPSPHADVKNEYS
jgi:hypothetical protein